MKKAVDLLKDLISFEYSRISDSGTIAVTFKLTPSSSSVDKILALLFVKSLNIAPRYSLGTMTIILSYGSSIIGLHFLYASLNASIAAFLKAISLLSTECCFPSFKFALTLITGALISPAFF